MRWIVRVLVAMCVVAAPASARVRIREVADYAPMHPEVTRLVTPDGSLVGGRLQQWVDDSRVAGWAGTLVVDPNTSACSAWPWHPPACAEIAPPGVIHFAANWTLGQVREYGRRITLFWEIAHEVDARYLTDADRARLTVWLDQDARRGGTPMVGSWWEMPPRYAASDEQNSGGEQFSAYYTDCAMGLGSDQRICRLVDAAVTR